MSVGILGGTFNPVHIGHLRLALEAAEALNLERVDLMPCAVPPHKPHTNLLPFELRVSLLRAATEGTPRLGVDTLEGELPAPSYTWNLITSWRERHGETPLFLLGDEDFAMLPSWYRGSQLPEITDFVVVPRSGTEACVFLQGLAALSPGTTAGSVPDRPGMLEASLAPGRRCIFLPLPCLDISASKVRALWGVGAEVRYLVPDPALALMSAHREEIQSCWKIPAPCSQHSSDT